MYGDGSLSPFGGERVFLAIIFKIVLFHIDSLVHCSTASACDYIGGTVGLPHTSAPCHLFSRKAFCATLPLLDPIHGGSAMTVEMGRVDLA